MHGGTVLAGKDKRGKLTILGMPPKKGPLIMLEKERKKDSLRSQDHLPPASPWTHGEDAVLCAVVHEYGGNWQLASDALGGGPDGGVYRGRHRHPIHCRERFRQLLAQNASAASGDPTSEKSALGAATNAQLKVTEVRILFKSHEICSSHERYEGDIDIVKYLTLLLLAVSGAYETFTRCSIAAPRPGAPSPAALCGCSSCYAKLEKGCCPAFF